MSLTSQWHFSHPQKVSLTGQWQCLQKVGMVPLSNCHWPVNDIFHILEKCHWPVNDSVSKRLEWCLLGNVIDRSMTFFENGEAHICSSSNCHWLVNDIFTKRGGSHSESKIFWSKFFQKMSLTGQWHISYGHRILGLWPNVIDFSQWQKNLWTLSLTAVNDP